MIKNTLMPLLFCLFFGLTACADSRTASSANQDTRGAAANEEANKIDYRAPKLTPHRFALSKGKSLTLNLPADFEISIAADGFQRPRFLVLAPDKRIFLTTMYDRTDNRKGAVFILDDYDGKSGRFKTVIPYLSNLRNPNSVAFYKDKAGRHWFYLALTDRLVRYPYTLKETEPSGNPEILARFPDYGLSYKYGGWHLTRTLAFNDKGKLYVSVGSSCNACEEKEEIRASVMEMDADGKNQRTFASGVRNAVGLKYINGNLFATNMGSDKLGDERPEDSVYIIEEGKHYGWPYCYEFKAQRLADPLFSKSEKKVDCASVPSAFAGLAAHSSPLGLEYFENRKATDEKLKDSFLVALHGSSKKSLKRGYRIVRVRKGYAAHDFITGFLQGAAVLGRPTDIMQLDANSFLFTDDHAGRIFYVFKKAKVVPTTAQ
jgi:glucose/arabinose dehydrogenase